MTAMLSALRLKLIAPSLVFAVAASCFVLLVPARSDVRGCRCESLTPAEMEKQRECSLCVVANKQPAYLDVFFLKDANPTKPNRLLVLPKAHTPGSHSLVTLPPELRHLLWTTAIAKAQESWGDGWAIAYNGDERRTQCHTHLHIGKLLPDQETGQPVTVKGPAEIPAPQDGAGLWVHPVDGKLHVHLGQQVNETVLMR
jgi:diadenosine tetraphosphate (Ap4A) HIT family hydrolase